MRKLLANLPALETLRGKFPQPTTLATKSQTLYLLPIWNEEPPPVLYEQVRRLRTRPVKRKPLVALLLLVALGLCGGFTWRFTQGNAGWQIRQAFPGAQPYFDPIGSPDPTISQFIRIVVPAFFSEDESLGFSLCDSPQPLDLQQRFARLSHLRFFSVHITRCKITNLCPTSERGFPGIIVFDDCDFSELPADQQSQLHPYDPTNPAATKQLCIGDV